MGLFHTLFGLSARFNRTVRISLNISENLVEL